MSTEADDRRELELLRHTIAEERRLALLVQVERDDLAAENRRLKADVDRHLARNAELLMLLAAATDDSLDMAATIMVLHEQLEATAIVAEIADVVASDDDEWMRIANAAGVNPQHVDRDRKLRVVPRQGGGS